MFEEIVTKDEIKFNDLEKKIFKFVCSFGCMILRLMLETYDRKLMKARDTKKYRHKGLRENTIKTIMGEVEYLRVMYEIEENVRKNKTTTSSYIATEHTTEGIGIHTSYIENNFIRKILKDKEIRRSLFSKRLILYTKLFFKCPNFSIYNTFFASGRCVCEYESILL